MKTKKENKEDLTTVYLIITVIIFVLIIFLSAIILNSPSADLECIKNNSTWVDYRDIHLRGCLTNEAIKNGFTITGAK